MKDKVVRNQVLIGNVLDVLPQVPSGTVQCVVTSPPYWGLRDYGGPSSRWGDGWEGGLGQEPHWEAYVVHLTEVFREVHRVLRSDGTLWLNLGDSYRNKQLLGLPWRVVLALQDEGWLLRSEAIWHKTSGMPENVTDRPTNAFEPVFMLTKKADYYYDAEAVRQPTGANRKNVWTFPQQPYKGAHSAVFPIGLPALCIQASTSEEGSCSTCGAPLVRELEIVSKQEREWASRYGDEGRGFKGHKVPHLDPPVYETKGWKKSCACPEGRLRGCLVLDPFAGSGTTLQAAYWSGRDYLGVEINAEALPEIESRLESVSGRASAYAANREGMEVPY